MDISGLMEGIRSASNWLGAILISGGLFTAFGFWLFKLFGERWMESRFARSLEALRHEQTKELERFRFQAASMLDRAGKVHQREYDVLPEVWAALVEANGHVQSAVSAFRQYPNVMFATDDQLDEILVANEITGSQAEEIKSLDRNDRQKALGRILDRRSAWRTEQIYRDFHGKFLRYGIFLGDDLKSKIEKYSDLLWAALIEHQLNLDDDGPRERTKKKELETLGKSLWQKYKTAFMSSYGRPSCRAI